MTQTQTVNSDTTKDFAKTLIDKLYAERKWFQFTLNFEKGRSNLQNSALHVYCKLLAEALNDAGYSFIIEICGKRSEIDWSMHSVKEYMWRPIQKIIANKKSSAKCTTKDYPEIYENLNRLTSERFGVSVDWPIDKTKAKK